MATKPSSLRLSELLKPHAKARTVGLVAVIGEGATNLLEPWPLKIVIDNVLKSQLIHGGCPSSKETSNSSTSISAIRRIVRSFET